MRITPETVRMLLREAQRLGSEVLAAACSRALGGSVSGELLCVALADSWRATPIATICLDQLHDLTYAAISADDWHATQILRAAATPDEHGWQSSPDELAARALAVSAWNARAERLRAFGIPPLELSRP